MSARYQTRVAVWLGLSLVAAVLLAEPSADIQNRAASKEALEQLNGLIGGWRGVGQPKRNSAKEAWTETAEWIWDLKQGGAALTYSVKTGKHLASARLSYDAASERFVLDATLPDKSTRKYAGTLEGNKLTLVSEADDRGQVHQVAITLLNAKRTLVLFQSKKAEQEQFQRVAEVGYTREGTRLAIEGEGEPECVVTGGKGTMSTVYKGKTYWFCCTGCRDAFNDDPDGIIADYEQKLAKRKAEMK